MFDTKLYVVRHAQGMGNLLGEFHGQHNSDLTDLGITQAKCSAEYLKNVHFDCACSSDIARAYSTGKIVASLQNNLEISIHKGLREIYAGEWETQRFDDIQKNYPELHSVWTHNLSEFVSIGGESVKELDERVNEAFCEIVKENAGKTILVTTHATPIRCMLCRWQSLPLKEITSIKWVPNASVTVVEYDSKTLEARLIDVAYCKHLEEKGLVTQLPKNI